MENTYDTSLMEAFRIPSGTAVELYATTLHYAPCNASDGGFLVAVVLPKGTNEALEHPHTGGEDALLAAKNKWLIGHPEGGLPEGSYIGLYDKIKPSPRPRYLPRNPPAHRPAALQGSPSA